MNLNFVTLYTKEQYLQREVCFCLTRGQSCPSLHEKGVWFPTQAGSCPGPPLWMDAACPRTPHRSSAQQLLPSHTTQSSGVGQGDIPHFWASEEWLPGAKLISGVRDSKPFPSLESERQPHTNSTARGRPALPAALLGETNTWLSAWLIVREARSYSRRVAK